MTAKGGTISSGRHSDVTTPPDQRPLTAQDDNWMLNDYSGACPVRDVLDRIGDKWSVLVVLRLGHKPERFRALMRSVEGISQRMLTVTLRGLERDGLVNRQVYDTRPPAVEYSLTPMGRSLLDHIAGLADWAIENETRIKSAQRAFDG